MDMTALASKLVECFRRCTQQVQEFCMQPLPTTIWNEQPQPHPPPIHLGSWSV